MKFKIIKIWITGVLAFTTFFSGIIRHDVDEQKYLNLAKEKQFDCVGQIVIDSIPSASCVLIGDRFVLAAAHIFFDNDTRQETFQSNGLSILINVPINQKTIDLERINLVFNGEKINVKKLIVHPAYDDTLLENFCDIAIIELEEPLTGIMPANLNGTFDEMSQKVVGVGFGAIGPANRPDIVKVKNKKIAGENVIDSMGGECFLNFETLLMCDFDHPKRKDCNRMGSPIPRPLEYICSGGDSGGGLFRQKDKKWELIGICSGTSTDVFQLIKTGYYGQTMEWTRVSVFKNWIEEQMQ